MAKDNKAEKDTKKVPEKKKKSRKNPFKAIVAFFKSTNAERKKVVWPTAKETLKNTLIVLVVTIVVGVAIFAVDSVLSYGMKRIKNLAENTTVSTPADEDEDESDIDIVDDSEIEESSENETAEDSTAE